MSEMTERQYKKATAAVQYLRRELDLAEAAVDGARRKHQRVLAEVVEAEAGIVAAQERADDLAAELAAAEVVVVEAVIVADPVEESAPIGQVGAQANDAMVVVQNGE